MDDPWDFGILRTTGRKQEATQIKNDEMMRDYARQYVQPAKM
jgi:hypothetical protein